MNKQELSAMVAEILQGMNIGQVQAEEQCSPLQEPMVKGSDYKPTKPVRDKIDRERIATPVCGLARNDEKFLGDPGEVEDISALDLRKLYLQENAQDKEGFARLKMKTPARLASGRAGARYKTLTMLRFRADHAAAQDAVFFQVPEDYPRKHGLVAVQTRCRDKDEYLTRPDLGRCFDGENEEIIRQNLPQKPVVQIVVGDGLSSAACQANAMDCLAAIRDGLKLKGIELGKSLFVRYCRVGAGDAVGDITGCKVVCVLVGERQGLVTDKSMSCYITYEPHTGVSESARTVVSNIHAQGTPAVEAGAHIAGLIQTILKRKVSGVGLHLEEAL
ncbi:MAG: ethanolamine ammonia-lyase subunit EutC [Oscillospiraceae bacterium]|nr:ethanolamine ammonia-lyase subunit EutC [Oscillospiraceae bacterium]